MELLRIFILLGDRRDTDFQAIDYAHELSRIARRRVSRFGGKASLVVLGWPEGLDGG